MTAVLPSAGVPLHAGLHRLFWRVHFWAGLITAPLVLVAALTGLLYVFAPQIEARWHADLDRVPITDKAALPLDQQVDAARAAHPTMPLRSVLPAAERGQTTQVLLRAPSPPHHLHADAHDDGLPQGRIVYIDPATAQVVGSLAEMQRFKAWARKLHSSLLQGESWRWLIELAASWMLVMFGTGAYLWWPRSVAAGGPGWRALVPKWGRGRGTWRDLHASVGVLMSGVLAVVLITGLTWSRYSGDHFRELQDALQQNSPRAPQALRSPVPAGLSPLSMQAMYDTAHAIAPGVPLQLTPPAEPDRPWRVDGAATGHPGARLTLLLDAYTGQVRYRSGWSELPVLAQATAVGIPFHRGEFGVWNQVVLALAALAAIFSVVSGVVMWWQRRPAGRVAAPTVALRHVRAVPLGLWLLPAAMAWAMPVFGVSLAAFVFIELTLAAARRARG